MDEELEMFQDAEKPVLVPVTDRLGLVEQDALVSPTYPEAQVNDELNGGSLSAEI